MAISLYYKIYRDLQYKICDGEYGPGALLPREADLEKIYGTSRAPVRQALGALENEKLILRVPGRGTFVTKRHRTAPWLLSSGFTKCYEREWARLSHKTVFVDMSRAPSIIGNFLGLGNDGMAIHLVRCQSVLEQPVVLMHIFTMPELGLQAFREGGDFMSLKELFSSKFNRTIALVEEKLAVEQVSASDAEYLRIDPGTWCLRIHRFGYEEKNRPLYASISYVRPHGWEYEVSFPQTAGADQ